METERAANKYKQVEFMQGYVGDDFDAIISGVSTYGFWAETVEHKCEGMISTTDLSEYDDFEFIEGEYALVGRGTGMRFAMGDKVRVQVVATNLVKRQIDFALAELVGQPRRKKRPQAQQQSGTRGANRPFDKYQGKKKDTKRKKK